MTSSVFKRLARGYLLPKLPGMAITGRLLYQTPVGDLLCGCHFEGSNFDKNRFVVTAFVQPLYVPAGHLVFSYGQRLGGIRGDHWWTLGEDAASVMAGVLEDIEMQAPRIHALGRSPRSFAEGVQKRGVKDYLDREAVAYSYLRAEEIRRGTDELELCLESIPESDIQIPWVMAMRERNRALLQDARSDIVSVRAKLSAWRADNLAALRIAE